MPLSKQEIFNNALFGIRGQNYVRSINPDSRRCMYRGANGTKCALGHSIPDEEVQYHNLDCLPLMDVIGRLPYIFGDDLYHFCHTLQVLHDHWLEGSSMTVGSHDECAADWERRMQEFAAAQGLVYTPV